MRGPGSLEGGTGELVGAGEEAKEDEEVFLQGGLDGVLEALEEVAEGGKDVASGGERRAEVDVGGEVGVDDAQGGGLGASVGEVGGDGERGGRREVGGRHERSLRLAWSAEEIVHHSEPFWWEEKWAEDFSNRSATSY